MASWTHRSTSESVTFSPYNNNNNSLSVAHGADKQAKLSSLNLTSYELAYHHHLTTALQMGQFYNSDTLHLSGHQQHPSSVTALFRGASAGSSVSAMNHQTPGLLNAVSGSANNCLGVGGIGPNSLWDTGLIPGIQRGSSISYPHLHHQQATESGINSIPQCEIWTGPVAAGPPPVVNGRGSGGRQHKSSNKKPRRRVATMAQRRAANIRERRRMYNLNEAFDKLRRKVPTFAYEKRLSRIETLRLAITYISFMGDILSVPDDSRNGLIGKTHTHTGSERKGTGSINNSNSNHHGSQYNLGNGRGGGGSNNGATTGGNLMAAAAGMDCHQNQNVPPPISPFVPLGRMYSHHPSSGSYLHPNMHH